MTTRRNGEIRVSEDGPRLTSQSRVYRRNRWGDIEEKLERDDIGDEGSCIIP